MIRPTLIAVLLAHGCGVALAQSPVLDPGSPFARSPRPLLAASPAEELAIGAARSQHPIPELAPALAARLARGQQLRWTGQADAARDTLAALLRVVPHHATVVTELARAELQRNDWPAAARLVRAERAVARDSLLAAREGAMAEERLGHAREAITFAVEAWAASGAEADWAARTLLRLAPMEPRAARDAMRGATLGRETREDLLRGRALVLARTGAPLDAARALDAPAAPSSVPLRLRVAEDLLMDRDATAHDSTAAREMVLATAGDARSGPAWRVSAARRAWALSEASPDAAAVAARLAAALATLAGATPPPDLALALARVLRASGRTAEARTLLATGGQDANPPVRLELLLADAREGMPRQALAPLAMLARDWPGARFALAEVRFWCGEPDSALALYQEVARDPGGADAGAALERIYLLEETQGQPGIAGFGRIAYEEWRGAVPRARALTDSLLARTDRGQSLWPHLALKAGEQRLAAGEARAALVPLLALADSLPADRLAPRARQRAGDALLSLRDERGALAQYEECLARYPRAWNAPEVRRRVEQLRKERRF